MEFNSLKKAVEDVRQDKYVYAGDVAKIIDVSLLDVHKLIEEHIEDLGLKRCYQLYCEPCQHLGTIYLTFNSMPHPLLCDQCHQEKNHLEETIVLYSF